MKIANKIILFEQYYENFLTHLARLKLIYTVLLFLDLFYAEALVWFDAGCSCTYHLNEESGTQQVCAEILFINGTELTTSEYSVTLSLDTLSATADSKPLYIIIIVISPPRPKRLQAGILINFISCRGHSALSLLS